MEENKKPENPSVYPDPMRGAGQSYSNQSPYELESGMTLRDYFAAKAMQGMLANNLIVDDLSDSITEWIANRSYEISDAMLKQR